MEIDITLMTVGDINVSRNVISYSKANQRFFRREEVRIAQS